MKTLGLILLAIATLIIGLLAILMLGTSGKRADLERIFKHNIHS